MKLKWFIAALILFIIGSGLYWFVFNTTVNSIGAVIVVISLMILLIGIIMPSHNKKHLDINKKKK